MDALLRCGQFSPVERWSDRVSPDFPGGRIRVPVGRSGRLKPVRPTGEQHDPHVRHPRRRGQTAVAPVPARRPDPWAIAAVGAAPSISSASVSTCVCARSTPLPANGWRGSSKTRRYGSTARRRCWREREAGFAMNTVLAPADSVLRRTVGAARHKARALLTQRMTEVCRRRCATASTS